VRKARGRISKYGPTKYGSGVEKTRQHEKLETPVNKVSKRGRKLRRRGMELLSAGGKPSIILTEGALKPSKEEKRERKRLRKALTARAGNGNRRGPGNLSKKNEEGENTENERGHKNHKAETLNFNAKEILDRKRTTEVKDLPKTIHTLRRRS